MRKRERAERSIAAFKHATNKYLADWLDRPFSELTGAQLIELHQQIKDRAAKRTGTNPANDKGARSPHLTRNARRARLNAATWGVRPGQPLDDHGRGAELDSRATRTQATSPPWRPSSTATLTKVTPSTVTTAASPRRGERPVSE
jgi:hypothetical protein